ncbi:MAG: radical SAM protein, partial [Bdellovibrionales bacterium]|nr:radical SAM protein [Bdellovibrionales bacterium]
MKKDNNKFRNYKLTASGEERASVKLNNLTTVWFNTGTLCNLKCQNCYIESSPTNDRLEYITSNEVNIFLNEIKEGFPSVGEIGLTGGEPFINPEILTIITNILSYNLNLLILTNGYNILKRHHNYLLDLNNDHPGKMIIRVSLDHHKKEVHEEHRGQGTFEKTLEEIKWLSDNGFEVSIAGRSLLDESISSSILAYKNLFISYGIKINFDKKDSLVIFPEMTKSE